MRTRCLKGGSIEILINSFSNNNNDDFFQRKTNDNNKNNVWSTY